MLSDLPSDRELATYLLGRFSRLDRYRKLAITHFVSPQWIEDIHADVGRPKWPRLVMFDNVPYLKRFRIGGQVLFVTSFVASIHSTFVFVSMILKYHIFISLATISQSVTMKWSK